MQVLDYGHSVNASVPKIMVLHFPHICKRGFLWGEEANFLHFFKQINFWKDYFFHNCNELAVHSVSSSFVNELTYLEKIWWKLLFINFNVIYIFHVIRYHVPNFCSHISKRTDSKMFRIYIWPSKDILRP